MQNTKIAFDLGGVILHRQALQNFIVQESDVSVKLAIQKFGKDNIYIISKAKEKYIQRNIDVLVEGKFLERTGLKQQNIYFVDEYEDKSQLMIKLGINYIVDDSIKVTRDCLSKGLQPILFGQHNDFLLENPHIMAVKNWKRFRKLLEKIPQ